MTAGCSVAAEDEAADESALSGHVFEQGTILRVTANALNVRSTGSRSARIVTVARRDELVTVIKTSGAKGWVNVRTADKDEGWASGIYLVQEDPERNGGTLDTSTPDGASCEPSRARDVVNPYEKALHDTIAFAEGTRDEGKDGYNVLFGHSTFTNCARHPNRCIDFRNSCSTAAGRYQFLNKTWTSIANARGYATFEPENQERGAAYLIANVRRADVPSGRALTSAEFSNVMSKLSYEWSSLPPGRYGQPLKSLSQLRQVYCSLVDC